MGIKTASMLMAAVALAAVLALPGASAKPEHCEYKQSTYAWSNDCTGMDDQGCVGQWGSKGTYTYDSAGNQQSHTTSSYRSVTCVVACLDMLGFSIPGEMQQRGALSPGDVADRDAGACADVSVE